MSSKAEQIYLFFQADKSTCQMNNNLELKLRVQQYYSTHFGIHNGKPKLLLYYILYHMSYHINNSIYHRCKTRSKHTRFFLNVQLWLMLKCNETIAQVKKSNSHKTYSVHQLHRNICLLKLTIINNYIIISHH